MRIVIAAFLAVTCFASFTGCSRKEAPPPEKTARISATGAFQSYFGPAPTTNKGTCYGFVIFAKEPGKVVPFPFFSFDEATLKKVAMERIIGGMDEKSYAGEFLQTFPKGTRLLTLSEEKGATTVNFSKELSFLAADTSQGRALFNAVSLTLAQFGGAASVRIQSDGKDLFPTGQHPPSEASAVLQPAPPRLLNLIAMKQTAAGPVEEVDALFDRPVDIKEFRFSLVDGSPIAGDVFHSMFDMAAVLKPKDPGKLQEGLKIGVHWKVVDKVGRSASGEGVLPLEVKVHQD
jgi:germination protein M